METQEKIVLLREAQDHLRKAIEALESAYEGDSRSSNYTYSMVLQSLEIALDDEHPFMTRDPSIETLINELEDESEDDNEGEESEDDQNS